MSYFKHHKWLLNPFTVYSFPSVRYSRIWFSDWIAPLWPPFMALLRMAAENLVLSIGAGLSGGDFDE